MGLHGFLWKFFPPLEVKVTISEIETFFRDYGFSIGKGLVESYVKAGVRGHVEETVYSIRIEHKKPEHLALIAITNALSALLPSGHYHTYRGGIRGRTLVYKLTGVKIF